MLGVTHFPIFSFSVIFNLVAVDFTDTKVLGFRVGEIEPAFPNGKINYNSSRFRNFGGNSLFAWIRLFKKSTACSLHCKTSG